MKKYKKIHKKRNLIGGGDIWMVCEDHFLLVKNKGYSEDYKRFFFDDIKWIKLVSTGYSMLLNILLVLVAGVLLLGAFAFYADKEPIGGAIFGGLSLVFFAWIIFDLLCGPSGKLIIVTHTQRDDLTVSRFRKGMKLLKTLKANIDQIKGISDKSELLDRMQAEELESGKKTVI
jgi:L-cystine uptake protein TcyP (sodium:dicarboxylate symporter family)